MIEQRSHMEALIQEEKRLTAIENHNEAWAEGLACGIEPEIIAEAAFSTACEELLRACGEAATLELLERVRERIAAGDFDPVQTRH